VYEYFVIVIILLVKGHLKGMFRSSLLVRLVAFEDEETIAEGNRRFLAHVHNSCESPLTPDLRSPAYRAALATGEDEVYDALITVRNRLNLHRRVENDCDFFTVVP